MVIFLHNTLSLAVPGQNYLVVSTHLESLSIKHIQKRPEQYVSTLNIFPKIFWLVDP